MLGPRPESWGMAWDGVGIKSPPFPAVRFRATERCLFGPGVQVAVVRLSSNAWMQPAFLVSGVHCICASFFFFLFVFFWCSVLMRGTQGRSVPLFSVF